MPVLVDTSIWIDYFRAGNNSEKLDFLIDENLIVINDLILAELIPSLRVRNQQQIVNLLHDIYKVELFINWDQIVEFQFRCFFRLRFVGKISSKIGLFSGSLSMISSG